MTAQIASVVEKQSLTTEEINRDIEFMHRNSERSASGGVKTARSRSELAEIANRF